ncbi:MAG: GFA family protein [Sphingobium sp.]
MSITGGCLCGAVKLAIDAEPVTARMCWCRDCQSWAAGSATVNVVFPADAISTTGEVRWYESTADSGNLMRRGFCPECGTPVFSMSTARPDLMIVRAGALDDPALAAPQSIIWAASAPNWAKLDPDLPHVAGQPGALPPR